MENVRYNISPCTVAEVDAFISRIDTRVFAPNGCVKSNERSHYDRYSFLAGDQRVAIVYDISASIVSITGRSDHAEQLLSLFGPVNKSVKRSTVPAQGVKPVRATVPPSAESVHGGEKQRAKLFVAPDRLKRRSEFVPVPTVLATSRGVIVTTDEIYPPQTVKRRNAPTEQNTRSVQKRPLTSYGENNDIIRSSVDRAPSAMRVKSENGEDNGSCGIAISVGSRRSDAPRKAVISFGSEDDGNAQKSDLKITTRSSALSDDDAPQKRKRGRPKKSDNTDVTQQQQRVKEQDGVEQSAKRKRGRPKKNGDPAVQTPPQDKAPEYKNGYSVKNYPLQFLTGAVKRLREYGKTVLSEGTEFAGTPQEVKSYTVTDPSGQKVILRYATKRMTLQLQGKRSELFGEVMAQVSRDSDYSSALESYVQKSDESGNDNAARSSVSDVQNKLKKRLPTAYAFLSEQSRIDFSYGIHDFGQKDLHLSDYSVLLVPAFRGLERFVFDLQIAKNINVKMIGQAFDKDENGKYVLKSGYVGRINSVIYPEVLVALYSEYFAQRNFFAHSDNTGGNASRSLHERADAQRIFEHLLDVVEYNAKKLKEIGFKMPVQQNNG